MEPRTFTDIEIVNRLRMADYWCNTKDQVVFTGDRGEPSVYRVEIAFQMVVYLACTLHVGFNYRWRKATREERETTIQAYAEDEGDREQARRYRQVYCLEEDLSGYDHELPGGSLNAPREHWASRPQRAPHRFFIVAKSVEIRVYYAGANLEAYLKQL